LDESRARFLIAEHLGVAPGLVVEPATLADLGADPLDVLALVLKLEKAFGVRITDAQADACVTVGDVLGALEVSLNCKTDAIPVGLPADGRR